MSLKRVLVAAVIGALLIAGCSSEAFVDEVKIVNETDYSANVDVTDTTRDGWLSLTVVEPHSTRTVKEVIDQGEVWVFRLEYLGKHHEEVEVSRVELERNEWTIEVPQSFEQRLRELEIPPPPP
jgi:hypothetical protein